MPHSNSLSTTVALDTRNWSPEQRAKCFKSPVYRQTKHGRQVSPKRHADVTTRKHFVDKRSVMKTRRDFLFSMATGSLASLIASTTSRARPQGGRRDGYGALVPDRDGLLDLPRGFQYRVFSREGDAMITGGVVP